MRRSLGAAWRCTRFAVDPRRNSPTRMGRGVGLPGFRKNTRRVRFSQVASVMSSPLRILFCTASMALERRLATLLLLHDRSSLACSGRVPVGPGAVRAAKRTPFKGCSLLASSAAAGGACPAGGAEAAGACVPGSGDDETAGLLLRASSRLARGINSAAYLASCSAVRRAGCPPIVLMALR